MAVLVVFAFVSGIITILSPCILPVLPVVLSGSVGGGKRRPLGIVVGFAVSFTIFTLSLTAIVQATGISADSLRYVAVVILILFGLVMIVPALKDRFQMLVSRVASRGAKRSSGAAGGRASTGFWSGVPVGISLGLVWTPCVGPIMASVITLALTQQIDGGAIIITLAYTIGTAIPMFAVMAGGRALLNRAKWLSRSTDKIQKVFGVLMVLVGVSIAFGWERRFQSAILDVLPGYGSGLTAVEQTAPVQDALESRIWTASVSDSGSRSTDTFSGAPAGTYTGELGDYGTAPDIVTTGPWINSEPLSLEDLRGKVVLIDFWTYSCVNCVRTIPHLRAW